MPEKRRSNLLANQKSIAQLYKPVNHALDWSNEVEISKEAGSKLFRRGPSVDYESRMIGIRENVPEEEIKLNKVAGS